MPLPTGSTADERPRPARDHPGGRRRGRAGARADRDPPATAVDLLWARDPVGRARGRRGRAPGPARAGRRGDQLAVRDHRRRAAGDRAQGRDRRRAEAVMTGVWIGAALLILVVLPIVVVLLKGVLDAAAGIVPTVDASADTAAKGSADLDATALLLTTQQQARTTIELVAAYGGSLDVILDDAERPA